MAEPRDENLFSTLPRKTLFARLKVELRDLKGEWRRWPTGHLRPAAPPAPGGEGLFERLREAARELKARPLESLADLFSAESGLLRPRAGFMKLFGASAAVHAVLLVVLLYSGLLAPLLAGNDEGRDYEVTMLAPEKLPPAPWLAVQTPDFAAGPDAYVAHTPAAVPPSPPAPSVFTPARPLRSGGGMTLPRPGPSSSITPADDASAEATPSPSPGASPQATPGAAGRTPATSASPGASPQRPSPNATPAAVPPGQRTLAETLGKVYEDYARQADPQPPPPNFAVEAEFKVETDGRLSNITISAPPIPPTLFGGMQEVLAAAGESRSFQSLSKLCARNALRLDTDDTTARLFVRCVAYSKEFADATTPVLTAVVRDALTSVLGPQLPAEVNDNLKVAADGERVEAVLTLPRQRAAELMSARPTPTPTPAP